MGKWAVSARQPIFFAFARFLYFKKKAVSFGDRLFL